MWRLLLFNVLADDFDGCAGAASGEVGRRPQRTAPQLLADARVVLFADHAAGDAFQAVHLRRDGDLRRIVHQQVDVVVLAVELHEFRLEVGADAGEDAAQVLDDFLGEYLTPAFGGRMSKRRKVKSFRTFATVGMVTDDWSRKSSMRIISLRP